MNRLLELQRDFSGFIWTGQTNCGQHIVANGFRPEQRLAIYRNNTVLGLTQALRDVYPVIARLVGKSFFNRLGAGYLRQFPPATGCLQTFGEHFPEFLAAVPEATGLPYLADTARLEWHRHQVYCESDQEGIDASSLTDVSPDSYGRLRFELHPCVRLLHSAYPVLRIWQSNQPERTGEDAIDLDEGGCSLLIHRSGWEIEMMPLANNDYRFLLGLKDGLTLEEAAAKVMDDDPEFDLAALLRLCLSCSLMSKYFIDN